MYDSTLHVLSEVLTRGVVAFELRVIRGISNVQALAAQRKIRLTRAGRPLHITTGRLIAQGAKCENIRAVPSGEPPSPDPLAQPGATRRTVRSRYASPPI